MRTLGEVIMIAAALALVPVAWAAGYQRFDRPFDTPLRAFLRGQRPVIRWPVGLIFFDDHSPWTVFPPPSRRFGVRWSFPQYGRQGSSWLGQCSAMTPDRWLVV